METLSNNDKEIIADCNELMPNEKEENENNIVLSKNCRTKNSARNIATGLLLRIICLLIPFIIRTIIIKKLGLDYLGLNSLFASILQVLSLSELGFSTSIAFSMYKPIQENNIPLVCALLKFLRKIYLIVGCVILGAGLLLMPFLRYLINGDYPADINLYILYSIYLFNTVISYFLFSHKSVLLAASQRSDIENNITIFSFIGMYILQIIVLLLFANYYIYIIFLPISTLAINIIREIICNKKYPQYKSIGELSKEKKKEINAHVRSFVGHRLSLTIVSSTDSIFISAFLGLSILAIYQNYYFIVSSLIAFISILYTSITASVGNSLVTDTADKNYNDFKKLTFLNVWIVGWMSICFICLAQHFMILWVGEENLLPLLSVVLMLIYFYTWKFKDMLCVYKDAAGLWKIDFWKPYVVSVLNMILDFVLVYYYGVNGALIATIVSVPIVSLPWETNTFFKAYFKRSPLKYYLRLLIYSIAVLCVGILTYFVCYLLPGDGYLWFGLKLVICLGLPNTLFLLMSFWMPEFKWVWHKTLSIFRRKKKNKENI